MSVPDNPFGTSSTTGAEPSPESLRPAPPSERDRPFVETPRDISPSSSPTRPIQNDNSDTPPLSDEQSRPRTPGESLLHPRSATAGSGPSKPSRHVQFNNQSHIIAMEPLQEPESPSRMIDPSNISDVDTALERHRTSQRRRRVPREVSHSSGDIADAEGDYDYRLDVDPVPDPGLEQVSSADAEANGKRGRSKSVSEGNMLQSLLGTEASRLVAGESIPLGETDGLPSMPAGSEVKEEHQEAVDLVRAHTGRWGVLRRRVKGAGAVNRAFASPRATVDPSQGDQADPEKRQPRTNEPEVEKSPSSPRQRERFNVEDIPSPSRRNSGGLPPLPGAGGGSVLSSLLSLYNQRNFPESATTSGASSRRSSEDEYSSDDSHMRRPAVTVPISAPAELSHELQDPALTQPIVETIPAADIQPQGQPHIVSPTRADSDPGGKSSHREGWLSYLRNARHMIEEKLDDADRPLAARSGAGVFGALLQSTSNVSAVATPAASALAPAAKRTGFQLNRFSEPDPEPISRKPWRPGSTPPSRRSSPPPSAHSSTAVSRDDSKSDLKKFSDDMALVQPQEGAVKKEKTKPHLDLAALHKFPSAALKESGTALKTAEKWIKTGKTPLTTPPDYIAEYFQRPLTDEERKRREWEKEKRRRKKDRERRKKQEIFIVQHVAAVLARQQFLLKLARALMMFGSPSHRLETQIQATARVLEINAQVVYLPGVMLVSFNDEATHTSETKFLKQSTGIDLGKVQATHEVYWNVVHDKISVDEAGKQLDVLMTTPVYYNWWQTLIIGALCSGFITVISFNGSFIDALMAVPLGVLLVAVQMLAAKNDMFSNVFEIAIATLISFLAAALADTGYFCYTALVSGGVVLILPGYIVLTGALELASKNITAGSVRIGYSVIYSLFLGFGISIGAEFYDKFTGHPLTGASTYTCSDVHVGKPWYQVTPSPYWWFLCCPGYSFALSLRNQQPLFAKELPIMVLFAVAGWCSNHFSSKAFPGRSDMTSAIGSFVVGTLGNIYGRFSRGASFPVTVTGILFQLPSGLANGGIFNFASDSVSGNSNAYSDGFGVAEQLVSVAIGLTVGLFVSAVVTHPLGGSNRSGSGIFAF